jgi:hypothetical protein
MDGETVGENTEGLGFRPQVVSVSARPARVILIVGLAALVVAISWLVYAASRSRSASVPPRRVRMLTYDRPFPAEGRFEQDPYVGSKACAQCHPGEAALHSRSGHAMTLGPAGRRPLARRLDGTSVVDPDMPNVQWTYRFHDDALYVGRKVSNKLEECIAEYAFGSGHHATTFVSVIDADKSAILEHRLTHYAHDDALGLTPGHDVKPPPPGLTPYGGVPPPRDALACFGCHATQLSALGNERIDEATMIPNVSCERCHGPGRAHVAAALAGAPEAELSLPFGPDRWTASELLRFCGECHRHPAGPRPEEIRRGDPHLARFQPIGIFLSECYRQSAGALSCVTCHDPHARASSHRDYYDQICLKCHSSSAGSPPQFAGRRRPAQVACRVSPREHCVECHMPRVDQGHNLLLSDHWIRVHEHDPAAAK